MKALTPQAWLPAGMPCVGLTLEGQWKHHPSIFLGLALVGLGTSRKGATEMEYLLTFPLEMREQLMER